MGGKNSGRKAKLHQIGDMEKTLEDWAAWYGRSWVLVQGRIRRGWPLLRALETPVNDYRRMTVDNVTRTLQGWASRAEVSIHTVKARKAKGMPPEKVVAPNFGRFRMITAWDRTQHAAAWAREHQMSWGCLRYRLDVLGMAPEKALTMPVDKTRSRKEKR